MARLQLAARTGAGLQRTCNEDAFLIAELGSGARHVEDFRGALDSTGGIALAVIDAMGNGFRSAETAGELAAAAIQRELVATAQLPAALRAASAAIFADIDGDVTREQQASVTLAVVAGSELRLTHIGATRAYRLRGGKLERLTEDDTMANDPELTSAAEASGFVGDRNLITTKWLGRANPTIGDAVTVSALEAGDVLLLSSIGLHLVIDDAAIGRLLVEHADPGAACDALHDAAMAAGGTFNITVLVARQLGGQSV